MKRSGNALVTGASSGLGRELVRQLISERGMTVMATARRIDRLEALAREFSSERIEILAGDLTDASFRQRLWDRAVKMPGGVDLLVNNAGVGNYSEFISQDPTAIHRILELNLVALLDLSQKAARHMKARGAGQILQISSVLGFNGLLESSVNESRKNAVNGLVKSLRYELWGTGVRVWAACPGRTQSEFRQVAMGNAGGAGASPPQGEPTTKVARAIVRGIDSRSTFLMPSWRAWLVVTLAHWIPVMFDWFLIRWSPSSYQDALRRTRTIDLAARRRIGSGTRIEGVVGCRRARHGEPSGSGLERWSGFEF